MDMDPDIANWVLEYLLRQPLEDRVLSSLLRALPLSNDKAHLKKILLLRKLDSDISRSSISESTLELFEQLEELEFRQGRGTVSDAMKRAYCAVAVGCTVKLLGSDEDDGIDKRKFKFFEAVKRVWRGRIGRMEKMVEKGGLGSDELLWWKDKMEAAVWEDNVFEGLVKKSEGVHAVEAVRDYVREEKEKMGPSFLELVAESVKDDESVKRVLGMEGGKEVPAGCDVDASNVGNNTQNKKIKPRDKHVGLRRSGGLAPGKSMGAKIADSNEPETGPSYRNYNMPSSAEVNKVREALESSASELRAVVKDPLPDALQFAARISGVSREENNRHDSVEENHVETLNASNVGNGPKRSLMERNSSAHTYMWDESPDRVASNGRPTLPIPRIINVPPLNKCEVKNLKRRRKGRKWSLAEEDALRTGVERFGVGSWKDILTVYHNAFEERTEVDLKDKWRNMTRHG